LVLYNQSLIRWSDVLLAGLVGGKTDKEYIEMFYNSAMLEDAYNPILARLEQTIEHNISVRSFVDSKRIILDRFGRLAEATAAVLKLDIPQATDVVSTFCGLVVCASRSNQKPKFDVELIPSDVRELLNSFSSKDLYSKNALRILDGIRRERKGT